MSKAPSIELPRGWCAVRLGELLFGIEAGKSFRCEPRMARGGEWGVIKVSAMTWGAFDEEENKAVPLERADSSKEIRSGDILLSRSNTAELVGASVLVGSCRPRLLLSDKSLRLIYSRKFSSRWLQCALSSPSVRAQMSRLATGTSDSMRNLSQDKLNSLQLFLPPAHEQLRIVDRADELFSDLDAGVAALERVRAKLKHYRAAVLKAAVEGALTAEWRRQHPSTETADALLTRILAERRRRWEEAQLAKFKAAGKAPPEDWKAKYVEPVPPDAAGFPSLPQGWRWVKLEHLIYEIEAGKSFECVPRPAQPDEWGIVKVSAMSWGAFDENENKTVPATRDVDPYYEIKPGDLLLSRANTYELVGASVLVNQCRSRLLLSDKSMRLLYSALVDKLWLKTLLSSPWVRGQLSRKSTGTKEGMRNVSQESVRDVVLPLAPAAENLAIVEVVEEQLSLIDHLERDLETRLQGAQALRQSILRHAFTGQLVPQDPNDEPASELLSRIAAEREERCQLLRAAKQAKPKTKAPRRRATKE